MPHLKILDLVISVKILFPDKVILTGFRDLICIFRGGGILWSAVPTGDGMGGSQETRLFVGGTAYCQGFLGKTSMAAKWRLVV